jgi:hypothetical protein
MPIIEGVFFCENCGIEILSSPYIPNHQNKHVTKEAVYYCCRECYQGYKCSCKSSFEFEEDRRSKTTSTIDSETF